MIIKKVSCNFREIAKFSIDKYTGDLVHWLKNTIHDITIQLHNLECPLYIKTTCENALISNNKVTVLMGNNVGNVNIF